jgi:hypothetical protein
MIKKANFMICMLCYVTKEEKTEKDQSRNKGAVITNSGLAKRATLMFTSGIGLLFQLG